MNFTDPWNSTFQKLGSWIRLCRGPEEFVRFVCLQNGDLICMFCSDYNKMYGSFFWGGGVKELEVEEKDLAMRVLSICGGAGWWGEVPSSHS